MQSLQEIATRLKNRIIAEFQKVNPEVVNTDLGLETPLSLAHAAEIKAIYMFLDEVLKQFTPETAYSAELSEIGLLEEYGQLVGIDRTPALNGIYEATFTLLSPANNVIIPAGTVFKSPAEITLTNPNDIRIFAGNLTGILQTAEAGAQNDVPYDSDIRLTVGITGVSQDVKISRIIQPAEDRETVEYFRQRILAKISAQFDGGTASYFDDAFDDRLYIHR